MSEQAPALSPAGRLPAVRWLLLGALLVGELLLLTVRYDTEQVRGIGGVWADLLGHSSTLPRVAIAVAAAAFLVGGGQLRDDLRRASTEGAALPVWPFLLAHLAVLAGFYVLTGVVLEGGVLGSGWAAAWALSWLLLAVLTLLTWASAALPASTWLPLARRSAGPLAGGVVIGLAAWGMGLLTDKLWVPLSRVTFWVVERLLRLVTADVTCDPDKAQIWTSSFGVTIDPECSGYEGIGLVVVFVGVYLWCYRKDLRFPAALLLLPAATLAIWVLNAFRIAALIAVGSWVSREAALGGFHSQAGWLAFTGVALGVVAVAGRIPWFRAREGGEAKVEEATATPDAAPAYLMPLMALLATIMVTTAFNAGFDWLYPLRVAAVCLTLWCFRRWYAAFEWGWSWTAVGVGVAVYVVWVLLEPAPTGKTLEEAGAFADALRGVSPWWALSWLVFRTVGTAVTVPIAEELAFRGFLTRRMIDSHFERLAPAAFSWWSFVASSVLFGLLHSRWEAGILAGMAYALVLYRRGRVTDAIMAHALTNALLTAHVLVMGAWWLW
jgi:exosortase E/protease (VPEID-CTERM system)